MRCCRLAGQLYDGGGQDTNLETPRQIRAIELPLLDNRSFKILRISKNSRFTATEFESRNAPCPWRELSTRRQIIHRIRKVQVHACGYDNGTVRQVEWCVFWLFYAGRPVWG